MFASLEPCEIIITFIARNAPMPNRKSDTNNHGAFSTDDIGMNYDYPDGDYATRERIAAEQWAPEVKDLLKEIGAW